MKTFFLLLALFISYYSFAQTADAFYGANERMMDEEDEMDDYVPILDDYRQGLFFEPDDDVFTPETWDTNFDNLLNSWYIKNHTNRLNHYGYHETAPVSDAVIIERLSKLPTVIDLPYNQTVRNCINTYIERRRSLVEYMLGLEPYYFPMIEETLDKYGLPLELKYLVIVESALNPVALSRAGASGLWQFMLPTGRMYGLEINSLVDERRDPVKATDAACRFLKDLYDTYGDWNLALAAYNCGGGNVNKAIRRANGKRDYWEIYPYLPRETRMYVPFFIAATYVMNYYAYHQLYPVQTTALPFSTDTVMINQIIHFDQIAQVLQIDKEIIRALNPQYKLDIIPGNYKPQALTLPTMHAYAFVEKEAEIATYRADELFRNRATLNRTERITHRVVAGETVITIANKYGVTAANVRRWNGLGSATRVAAGRNLTIHVDNGGFMLGSNTGTSSASQQAATASSRSSSASTETVRYRVRSGDTYSSIAQRYRGISYADLMRLNNATSTNLRVGQYILVPKN